MEPQDGQKWFKCQQTAQRPSCMDGCKDLTFPSQLRATGVGNSPPLCRWPPVDSPPSHMCQRQPTTHRRMGWKSILITPVEGYTRCPRQLSRLAQPSTVGHAWHSGSLERLVFGGSQRVRAVFWTQDSRCHRLSSPSSKEPCKSFAL